MPGRLVQYTWQSNPTLYAPAKYKRACRYHAFVPEPTAALTFTIDSTLAGLAAEAEQSIRALNDSGSMALRPLARLLLRTESIASSKVEGLQLGIRALARAEARLEVGRGASETAIEVLSNIEAMVLAVHDASSAERFAVSDIIAIHQRLMEGAPNSRIAGLIRTQQNWIGGNDYNPCGADFVPPPPDHIARLLADLCDAINADVLPPIIQAALVHAQFETIHPFDDGNGRTGRALIQVVLRRRGVAPAYLPPISVVLADAKSRYIDGLTNFRGDDISPWIEYFAAAAARAAHLATAYLRTAAQLDKAWRARVSALEHSPRSDAAVWALIAVLPAHPMITAPIAVAATGRAKAAVYQAIGQLQSAGVLIPLTDGRRNQAWEVAGMLELIEGLESATLPARMPTLP